MKFFFLTAFLILLPATSHARSKISTFMEGTLVEKSINQWVVLTKEGTYWINLTRPPSWIRRGETGTHISFWVRTDQISRFRPSGQATVCRPDEDNPYC